MSKENKIKSIKEIIDSTLDLKDENLINLSLQIEKKINDALAISGNINDYREVDLGKLLLFFKVHIQNLRNEIPKVIQQSKEIKNIIIKEYEKQKALLIEKVKKIKEKVDTSENISNKREELLKKQIESLKKKIKENEEAKNLEINELKKKIEINKELKEEKEINKKNNIEIHKNKMEIQNQDLTNKYETVEISFSNSKNKESEMTEKEKIIEEKIKQQFENKIASLESYLKEISKKLIEIKNRDNYKSIIYIFLIKNGFNFQNIEGNIYDIITNSKINEKIQKFLLSIYKYYDDSKFPTKEGYTKNIMEQLFPKNEFSNLIEDKLINEMKDLIYNYENNKYSESEKKEKININEKIENMIKKIMSLQL